MLPADLVDQLQEAARRRGARDEDLAVEAIERGLAGRPKLCISGMKRSRPRPSPAAAAALGRPAVLIIDVLGGNLVEVRAAAAAAGVPVRHDR